VKTKTGQHVMPARRRWRPFAIASAAAVVLAGGLATANAATSSSSSDQASVLSTSGVDAVVKAADAFLDTLSDDQQDEVVLDFSETNVADWSNLACGSTCRPGIAFSELSDTQLTAAEAVLAAAMGTGDNVGYQQAKQILKADDYLSQNSGSGQNSGATSTPSAKAPSQSSSGPSAGPSGSSSGGDPSGTGSSTGLSTKSDLSSTSTPGVSSSSGGSGSSTSGPGGTSSSSPGGSSSSGPGGSGSSSGRPSASPSRSSGSSGSDDEYGSGNYYLAFLGTPSTSGDWQLHFGGDNLAINLTYADGGVVSASPYYIGVEPTSFTTDGTTYTPLDAMRTAMLDLTAGLTETEADEAHSTDSVSDVVLGPGEDDQFPSSKQGLAVSDLSDDQQALVLDAIEQWVQVADDDTAAALLAEYKADLDETYIQYAGSPDLDAAGDYVRIDGPGVWIEFLCQTGTADSGRLSYQSIYRDHDRDYGGEFTF
jgi:hypothetical protein